jgi:DNA-directed RNA polymerase subunit L
MTTVAKITELEENEDILKFTLSNVNVSYANALRRVIISNIPCIVFKSTPYIENKVNIKVNKTRLNNELLKQRISSIPIHIDNIDEFPYEDYVVELNKSNTTNNIIYVTSEDFKIKNVKTDTYLNSAEVKNIFPPDKITGDYIDITRLRPKLSEQINSEELILSAELSVSSAEEEGMYNVVSTCCYGNTLNVTKINEVWEEKEKSLIEEGLSKENIEYIKKDWLSLDAKRLYVEDSFDFIIETLGIYSNFKLLELASSILIKKLYQSLELLKSNNDLIKDSEDTMDNCYTIILENEDYTVGKIIEYSLYSRYFIEKKLLNYVGFLKKHPHDKNSIIKVSFKNITTKDEVLLLLEDNVNESIVIINTIKDFFSEK